MYANNGWSSEFFSLSRRVRQGCPLSPYLFILCAEVLANTIRKDENIHGNNIINVEYKLSQYADDTTMILDDSELSLSRTLLVLDNFTNLSGLKINYKKTKVLWIGPCNERDFSIPLNKPITWARGKVYAFDVLFSTSEINESNINFPEKIEKIKNEQLVSYHTVEIYLSLEKIAILKSPIIFTITSRCYQGDCLLYDFLWDSKGDKIKRTEIINEYTKGGLKMIDLQSFNESSQIKWIKGYLDDNNKGKWKSFVNHYLEKHSGKLFFHLILKNVKIPLYSIFQTPF